MRNRILEIVVFLMDFLQQGAKENFYPDELSDTLEQMGYSDSEISSAYRWMLERLQGNPEKYFNEYPKKPMSQRVLSSVERQQISAKAIIYKSRFGTHYERRIRLSCGKKPHFQSRI